MPYKVYFRENGPFTVVDSLEDAAQLMRLAPSPLQQKISQAAGQAVVQTKTPENVVSIQPSPENINAVFLSINQNAKVLLLAIAKHEKGVRGDQIAEETKISVDKMGGILGGASKLARKNGLELERFVRSEMRVSGSERYRFFTPEKLLLENIGKLKQIEHRNPSLSLGGLG